MHKLIIDVGNTNIKFGLFKNDKLIKVRIISTESCSKLNCKNIFTNTLEIKEIYIGSVVKEVNSCLANKIYQYYKIHPYFITPKDFSEEFDLSKFNINEIGVDILGFALLIKKNYSKGLGISFGTATFGVAINNKKINGVVIAPSIELGIHQLNQTTSLIKSTHNFQKKNDSGLRFGNTTVTSLSSGAEHMAYGFVKSILNYVKNNYKIDKAYITGGKSNYLGSIYEIPGVKLIDNAVLLGYYYLSKII